MWAVREEEVYKIYTPQGKLLFVNIDDMVTCYPKLLVAHG